METRQLQPLKGRHPVIRLPLRDAVQSSPISLRRCRKCQGGGFPTKTYGFAKSAGSFIFLKGDSKHESPRSPADQPGQDAKAVGVILRLVWLEIDGFHWLRRSFGPIYLGTPQSADGVWLNLRK